MRTICMVAQSINDSSKYVQTTWTEALSAGGIPNPYSLYVKRWRWKLYSLGLSFKWSCLISLSPTPASYFIYDCWIFSLCLIWYIPLLGMYVVFAVLTIPKWYIISWCRFVGLCLWLCVALVVLYLCCVVLEVVSPPSI